MIFNITNPHASFTIQIKEKDFPLEKFSDRLFDIIKKYELATYNTPNGLKYRAIIVKRVDLEKTTNAVVYDKEMVSAYAVANRRKTILQYKFEPKV